MSTDLNIKDQCLSIPNTSGNYWTNTNLQMTTTADPGLAVVGQNTTKLTIFCGQGSDGSPCPTQIGGATRAVFELYLSPAAMNFSLTQSKLLGTLPDAAHPENQVGGNGQVTPGQPTSTTIPWQSQDTDPTQANYVDPTNASANHKCLIARCYTDPDKNIDEQDTALVTHTMQTPYDPHYAQQNLNIQPIGAGGHKRIGILNGNPTREAQVLTIQAVPNLNPNPEFVKLIMPALQAVKGFKQISTTPLRNVRLNLEPLAQHHGGGIIHRIEEIIEEEIKEVLRRLEELFGIATPKGGGALGRVKVSDGFFGNFEVIVDPSDVQNGHAYILDVTQANSAGEAFGGQSLVIVAG